MDTPTAPTNSGDDAILIEISILARRYAGEIVARDVADDIAQDVVLECLIKVRAGTWRVARDGLATFVRSVVRRRSVDWLRRSQRRSERNAEHAREISESTHAWMSPDLSSEERELAEFHDRALASLPPACRRAYVLVREERITYDDAADRLGVTRSTVSSFVVRAQRRFRRQLSERGIHAPSAYNGKGGRGATRTGR